MANADVQFLAGSNANGGTSTHVDTFTVTAADGTTQLVSFTIHGTNDAPTVSGFTITESSINFIASDVDNPILSLASPFAAAFGNPTLTSGATTILTPTAQTTAVSGTLQVTDGLATADVIGLYLGTGGNDTATAPLSTSPNAMHGFSGDDTLTGGTAADSIFGGANNDTIVGGGGTDMLVGDAGNDTITYEAGATIHGDAGSASAGTDSDTLVLNQAATIDLSQAADQSIGDTSTVSGFENVDASGSSAAVTVIGSSGANILKGGSGADTITGGAGADTLSGGGGNDTFNLANGDFAAGESIDGGANTDSIALTNTTTVDFTIGTVAGVETLTGSSGGDAVMMSATQWAAFTTIDLAGGSNVLNVVASGDIHSLGTPTISNVTTGRLVGTTGDDSVTLTGAQLDAIIFGGGTITLGPGTNDTINLTSTSADLNSLGAASDASITGVETISAATAAAGVTITLSAQIENFTITGSANANSITGGSGADTIVGAQNDTLLNGGGGTDTLQVGANFTSTGDGQIANIENVVLTSAVTLNLSNQTEGFTITGSAAADSITAGGGNDIIVGADSDTLLAGGAGSDTLSVGTNFTSVSNAQITGIENVLLTAAATLNLSNQTEGFTITGSAGADSITGGSGADTIIGAQNDTLLDGGANNDTLNVGANFTNINNAQIANIENVLLTAAATLNLNLQTEGFNINGSSGGIANGADTIIGGSGADTINGQGGNDTLTGNGGADQFRLRTNGGTDTINDYTDNTDKIGFLGGAVTGGFTFGNTAASSAGTTLNANDLTTRNSISNINNNDDNQVDVIDSNAQTTTQITNDTGNAGTNLYVIVFNSTTAKGEIWFDTDWSDTANRVQVATLNNVTTLAGIAAITASDIVVYDSTLGPAGVAGSPINLALTDPTADATDTIAVTFTGVASGWTVNGGIDLGNGIMDGPDERSRCADGHVGGWLYRSNVAPGHGKLDQCGR